ncbi:MAG: histidine--tRNA ligase [Deltaproteobacteria bacterium]|nr:MAG: histidine--tRNA ligase [Deltaproteobacteria bacterium]
MIKAIRGFNDILPDEIKFWEYIIDTSKKVFKSFGYKEIIIPILEKTDLFLRSIGEATDIVEKEMYTFSDKKGNSITLRPEATAGIIRAYLEHNLYTKETITKLYLIGPMFRYERPQKGRYRQFYQIDAEVLGEERPLVDAEILVMVRQLLNNIGIDDVQIEINSLGCKKCRGLYIKKLISFLEGRKDELCSDCRRRLNINPLRILDCKVEGCRKVIQEAPIILDYLCNECSNHFSDLKTYLGQLELPFIVNPLMVRGLDYYTRTTFEVTTKKLGSQNAVVAGGRYDNLIKELGGPDIPAIGFAMGIERLVLLLKEKGFKSYITPLIFVASLGEDAKKEAINLVKNLREASFSVEMDYSLKSLKAQLKRADKLNAKYVLIIGEDELANEEIIIRDMEKANQEKIKKDYILNYLKEKNL